MPDFNVIDMETGELLCECASFLKAVIIAQALRNSIINPPHFAVRRGDEIKYDTEHGRNEA